MNPINEEVYRSELRNHFMGQMKNSKLQHSAAQHYKDHAFRAQKLPEFESYTQPPIQQQQQQRRQATRSSGGDADRALYDAGFVGQHHSSQADSYRGSSNYNEQSNNFSRHFGSKATKQTPALALPSSSVNTHKYHPDDANVFLYETDSNIGGCGPGSEDSNKSQKSSKTVVSKKSSQDLRKIVKSQCKLHEVIDETLKQMCATDPDHMSEPTDCRVMKETNVGPQMGLQQKQPPPGSCKRCTDKVYARSSQKDVMTEISKGDFLECRSGETLTISVDDVVNSKVINPMIRKLQRMYLNNLREEMSLMEDLERLPHKVNEVYKATIFKQKE